MVCLSFGECFQDCKKPLFQTHAPACVRESLRTLCHHDNASSMSEWVYSFHLVIHSAQLGNSCVHAGRVQTNDNIKIHLISENMFTLVGIVWVAGVDFDHMQRIEFHFDAFWCLLVRSCPTLFFFCSMHIQQYVLWSMLNMRKEIRSSDQTRMLRQLFWQHGHN